MKSLLLALAILSWNSYADSCPNLSGTYVWYSGEEEDGSFIKLTIAQNHCVSMTTDYDMGWDFTVKHNHAFDGQKRLVEDNGDFNTYETALIDPSGVHIMEERNRLDEESNRWGKFFVRIYIGQPSPDILVIKREYLNDEGGVEDTDKTVYKRLQR